MQDFSKPSRGESGRWLATVTVGALVALLVVAIPLGHRHVQAAAAATPDVGQVATAPSGGSAIAGVDASLPAAAEALRLVPTTADEPTPTF